MPALDDWARPAFHKTMPQSSAADPTYDEESREIVFDCCVPDGWDSEREPLIAKRDDTSVKIEESGGMDIVQFNSFIYYADELEGVYKVDIIRLGSMIGKVAVKYSTQDLSAKASQQYGAISGVAVFEDGEYTRTIDIPILDDGVWSSCKEFKVMLSEAQNCHLGLYLHHCRVKILNAEMFPSDGFKEQLTSNVKSASKQDLEAGEAAEVDLDLEDLDLKIHRLSNFELFYEYCQLNYYCAGVQSKTLLIMVFDQLSGLVLFMTLYVGVYIVDTLFARNNSQQHQLLLPSRYHTAILIACWFVVPHIVLLVWEALKVYIDIKGASREYLQLSMMRTTMDYSQRSRQRVSAGDINVAMVVNAETVATGYVAAVNTVGILGRLIAIQLFILWFQPDRIAIGSGIVMIVLVFIFMAFRVDLAVTTQERLEEKIMTVSTITDESNQKYRLFADYFKQGVLVDLFSAAVKDYSSEKVDDTCQHLITQFAPKILSGIITANYIIFRTNDVLSGHLSLGIFLASITIFVTYMTQEIADLNNQLMLIVDAFACLKEFTRYFNLPLELVALRNTNIDRRQESVLQISRLSRKAGDGTFKADNVPIMVSNLTFVHNSCRTIVKNVSFSIPQGHFVAVTGAHNSGKSTLIQLLAGIIVPTEGRVFVPSHLRILHVSREPVFMHTSMLHNMALGLPNPTNPSNEDRERIMRILVELDLQDVVDIMNDEAFGTCTSARSPRQTPRSVHDAIKFKNSAEMSWEKTLTQSEKVKLHIARALVSNPEVMIIDRTIQGLNTKVATGLLNILRRHMSEKGLCLPKEDYVHRRPRTVIFSTEVRDHAAQADTVLELDPANQSVVQTSKAVARRQFMQGCLPIPS